MQHQHRLNPSTGSGQKSRQLTPNNSDRTKDAHRNRMETISLQGQEISELILESTAPWDNQLCFEAYGYE